MADGLPAARVGDPFGHSAAMTGVLVGLAVGALVGVAIVATGGLGAIAIGAAIATTGGAGLAGQAIGQTIEGPVTGALMIGSPTVLVNSRPATMTVLANGICAQDSGPPRLVATGAATVLVHGQPMARVSELMDCSATIRKGSPDVLVGGPSVEIIKPEPEVPTWLSNTMMAMAIGGTLIATGGIAAGYGLGAAVGSLVGGVGGGYLGGKAGGMAAAAMGFGATGQAVGEVVGGVFGGALGGGFGFRGGQAAGNRIWTNPTTRTGVMLRQGTSGGNPAAVAAVNRMPPDFRSEYAAARAANWKKPNGDTWWPPNDGAVGKPVRTTIDPTTSGPPTTVDRFGGEHGSYLGKPGDSFSARALPGEPSGPPNVYKIDKPTHVEQAEIAPWFDQPGGGTQYKLVHPTNATTADGKPVPYSVKDAKRDGYMSDGP